MSGCRVYVGNLPINIREREIEDLFYKYGRIRDIDLKTPSRPPAFAFVVFDDPRDAEDAIRGRDGYNFDGDRLRVEMAKGDRGGPAPRGGRGAVGGGSKSGGGRRTEWGVVVTGLPRSCSWQDLKDYMRKGGDVVYTDVDSRGEGIVEYATREDMESAVRKLDDTEFKNPYDSCFIRVNFARGKKDSRSRSRSADRGDRRRGRDRDASYSRSPSRSRSRDRSSRDKKRDHDDKDSDKDDKEKKGDADSDAEAPSRRDED